MKIKEPSAAKIACPYIYAKGRRCTGHIVAVEAFKADLSWTLNSDGTWKFAAGAPRSHYHLHCSEKGNHAGYGREDALKYYLSELPDGLAVAMQAAESSGGDQ